MNLTPREIDKLHISMAAEVARKRKGRGLKLNHPESVALIADHILEGARDGKSVSDLMSSGKKVLSKDDVIKWTMSDDINREKVRIIYENDEIGVEHSFVTFKDGNTQAVMGVFKYQNGKIISFETGATNIPK